LVSVADLGGDVTGEGPVLARCNEEGIVDTGARYRTGR
jgi:hypothetical protein